MARRRSILRKCGILGAAFLSVGSGCTGYFTEREAKAPGEEGPAPPATFDFEYSTTDEILEVVLSSGANLPPDNVYLRGSGLEGTGSWNELGGMTTGSSDGNPMIAIGDSLTIGAKSDFKARVVWETSSETSTYREKTGPDA